MIVICLNTVILDQLFKFSYNSNKENIFNPKGQRFVQGYNLKTTNEHTNVFKFLKKFYTPFRELPRVKTLLPRIHTRTQETVICIHSQHHLPYQAQRKVIFHVQDVTANRTSRQKSENEHPITTHFLLLHPVYLHMYLHLSMDRNKVLFSNSARVWLLINDGLAEN